MDKWLISTPASFHGQCIIKSCANLYFYGDIALKCPMVKHPQRTRWYAEDIGRHAGDPPMIHPSTPQSAVKCRN